MDVTQLFPSYTGGKQPRAIRYVLMFAMSASRLCVGQHRAPASDSTTSAQRASVALLAYSFETTASLSAWTERGLMSQDNSSRLCRKIPNLQSVYGVRNRTNILQGVSA